MIITDDGPPVGDENTGLVLLVSANGSLELSIQVEDKTLGELREHLLEHGFRVPEGAARSTVSEVIVATAGNPAAWTAVGGIVVAFLRRHRGKAHRFKVNGKSISIDGYSRKDAEKLAADLLDMSREREYRQRYPRLEE